MSSSVAATALGSVGPRKCSFCAEEILADARKCRHCGEFVAATLSRGVGAIFAAGVVIACLLAGMQPALRGCYCRWGVGDLRTIVCQNGRQRLIEDSPAYRFASSNAN